MAQSASGLASSRLLLVGTADWIEGVARTAETRAASVRTVDAAADALDAVRSGTPDCVVTAQDLGETTGIDLLREVRAETDVLPVILVTDSGSEAIASEAIAAGVTDYVPVGGPGEPERQRHGELLDRVERAVRSARHTGTRRDRARQFDAVFHDARRATWVLDPEGSVRRANGTARGLVDGDEDGDGGTNGAEKEAGTGDAHVGEPFWALPCWESGGERADVRGLVEEALDGEHADAAVGRSPDAGNGRVIDLSVRPVTGERGDLVSVVVEGVDVTDRADLERDLRRSEELHRVTLNNMTDTVLITDEEGEYTYVCPNVHFIFGYAAEEIREMGSIDALLGEDLFDRDELAEEGILRNIECTVTDRAGREHTLLVNVREVSIQGGTLLYSCRDITKRKQRERALATLQGTAREFLYAGTHGEIAQRVVEDTPGILDLDASAVYLFDADDNDLRPAAYSARMEELNGPLPTVPADGETLPSYSFVENEPLFFDDVHTAGRLANPATDLRSVIYVPLGDHGVFVAGTDRAGGFDDVVRELADLLAATAEAALDRVSRESQLREQERRLQRQNDELTDLNRINGTIREIDQALVGAETREEIDHTVCELLTADDRFSFAWIGAPDRATGTVEPRAWAGAGEGYLDSRTFTIEESGVEPAGRTAATDGATVVTNVAAGLREEPWRKDALARDFLSVLSIPLVYNEFTYGVLTVYAGSRDAFDGTSRAVLGELGETIASAISAIERKNALLTASTTRLEFAVEDPSFVLSRLAREADCTLSYRGGVQRTTDGSYVFVTVEDGLLEAVEEAAADLVAVEEVTRISTTGAGGVLGLRLSGPFLALDLADHGAVLRRASADGEATTLVVDMPESVETRRITTLLHEAFDGVELRSKRTVDRTTAYDLPSRFLDRLTDRQLEVLQTAYYSGFFESPRESTGEDVAGTLGISSTAFYQHVRTVQRKLFSTLFDEVGVTGTPDGVE